MVDVSLIPEAAWCEARRRAEVIRPLVESAHRSRHLVEAAAATLGLSERQTYTILRRCREDPRGTLRTDGEKLLGRANRKDRPAAGQAAAPT